LRCSQQRKALNDTITTALSSDDGNTEGVGAVNKGRFNSNKGR
jgi:hypothetical protein